MELNPKAKKMWAYLQDWNFVLPTTVHVDTFCDRNKAMDAEDKELFKQLWLKLNNKEDCCEEELTEEHSFEGYEAEAEEEE